MRAYLLTSPLFILKQLQYDTVARCRNFLSGAVLDIGCGGRPYRSLVNATRYVGLDLAVEHNPDLIAGCVSLPLRDNVFDSVICTEVLEHLADPDRCLCEVRRVLKPGGHAYISVPQSWCLHYPPHDYWRFTRYGLCMLAERNGLRVLAVRRIGGVFSLAGVRLADVCWSGLCRFLAVLGSRNAERLATLLCLPWSLFWYVLALIADRIDERDALGWACVVRK